MKKMICLFCAAGLGVFALAPQAAAAEKMIVKKYKMGHCLIIKTRHWDVQKRHWDVTSKRVCN